MSIIINQNITIELTPEHLAKLFCGMDDSQQAVFFNHVGQESALWPNPIEFQLTGIRSSEMLNKDGSRVLQAMSQMFATYDIVDLLDACTTVVRGYETDGFEGMRARDIVFNNVCKKALKLT